MGKAKRAAAVVIGATGALLGVLGVLPECSSGDHGVSSTGDATDVTRRDVLLPDTSTSDDSSAGDATDEPSPPPCDVAADAATWPGWQPQSHVSTLSPCCPWGTPLDAAAAVPPYAWVPCDNGAANCLDFETTSDAGIELGPATVSRDGDGNPKWLMLGRNVDPYAETPYEEDLYDIASGTVLGAWRMDDTLATFPYCEILAVLGQTTVTVNGLLTSQGFFVGNGAPASMMADPSLERVSPAPQGVYLSQTYASDRVFAFEGPGILGRTDFGSGTLQRAHSTTAPPIQLSMVEGDDVFAYSQQGTAGWGQLYVVDASGDVTLLRSNPDAHVATPASDGTRIYWTETYGTTDVTKTQSTTEFWSAPYTADPVVLAATAAKFAAVQNPQIPSVAIAFGGLMAMTTLDSTVFIARLDDGKVIQPSPGPGRDFWQVIAVTPSELWTIEGTPQGPPSPYLSRIGLGDW